MNLIPHRANRNFVSDIATQLVTQCERHRRVKLASEKEITAPVAASKTNGQISSAEFDGQSPAAHQLMTVTIPVKRPDPHQKQIAKRRQVRCQRRQIRVSRKLKRKSRVVGGHGFVDASIVVPVPQQLKYYSSRSQRRPVESFFSTVDRLLRAGRSVTLDFSAVTRLFPCGVLILMGWVDEWVQEHPNRITGIYPTDDLVEQMLQQVQILGKLGLENRKKVDHVDVTRWHYFSGTNADATPMEPFMAELREVLGEERQLGLGSSISEAMTNVRHHAYVGRTDGPWWIFATISEKRVFLAIHDRGASVPQTLLTKPTVLDYVTGRRWFQGWGDGSLIASAIGGRTATQLPYRGKGLPEMLEFTKSCSSGELGIFSRRGFFRYWGENLETFGRLTSPIQGTLVIWMLNL